MGQVAMAREQQEDVNRGFIGRHAGYWSKAECIRKELSLDSQPMRSVETCDALGLADDYIGKRLFELRTSLNRK